MTKVEYLHYLEKYWCYDGVTLGSLYLCFGPYSKLHAITFLKEKIVALAAKHVLKPIYIHTHTKSIRKKSVCN